MEGEHTRLIDVRMALSDVPEEIRSLVRRKLLLLGYKEYCKSFGPNLDEINLLSLLGTSSSSSKKGKRILDKKKISVTTTATTKKNEDMRRSRPDAMKSYPFSDITGSVNAVMKGADGEHFQFAHIGIAARKRMAQKVFSEYSIGHQGMPISEIPEGLKSLGLPISEAGRDMFDTTSKKKIKMGSKAIVTVEQFTAIVERYVTHALEDEKKKLAKEQKELEDLELSKQDQSTDISFDAKDDELDNSAEGEPTINGVDADMVLATWEKGITGDVNISAPAPDVPFPAEKEIKKNKIVKSRRSAPFQARRMKAAGADPTKIPKRRVESRIAGEVRADRRNYHMAKVKVAEAALTAIGKLRINDELDDDEELNDSGPEDEAINEGIPIFGADKIYKPKKFGKPVSIGRWDEMSSGSTALEIAESFFKGSVGRELMRNDPSLNGTHPFADILGPSEVEKKSLGYDHRTSTEKEEIAKVKREAANLYTEGWKQKKGGWVADFGPPHTRTISPDAPPEGADSPDESAHLSGDASSMDAPKESVSLQEAAASRKSSLFGFGGKKKVTSQ